MKTASPDASIDLSTDLSTGNSIEFCFVFPAELSNEPATRFSVRALEVLIIFFVLKTASKNPYVSGPTMMPIGPITNTGAIKAMRVIAGWIAARLLASLGLMTKSGIRFRKIIPRKTRAPAVK